MEIVHSSENIENLPDLALDQVLSYLDWPEAMLSLFVSQRLRNLLENHLCFVDMLDEQRAAVRLGDPMRFPRTRADLPQTAKSTIALAFSSNRRTLASTHGDHTVKLVDVVQSMSELSLSFQSASLVRVPTSKSIRHTPRKNCGATTNSRINGKALHENGVPSRVDIPSQTAATAVCGIVTDYSESNDLANHDNRSASSADSDEDDNIGLRSRSTCVLTELRGHPRTPWTVKFHPTKVRHLPRSVLVATNTMTLFECLLLLQHGFLDCFMIRKT